MEKTWINKVINESEVTPGTTENQRIIRKYYKQLYDNKLNNLGEVNKFLETYTLLKLNQEEIESPNRLITANEFKAVIKKNQL